MDNKIALLGKTLVEIRQITADLGMPSYSSIQICEWLYKKKVRTIDEMTNLSAANRQKLSVKYDIGYSAPVHFQKSIDGTIKYLFETKKKHFVEAVYIPDDDRATLCVSSQVGCKMNCLFCMTGKQGFVANLSTNEIINQIWSLPERDDLTNIVFMGMGEPMDNLEQLLKSLDVLTSEYGFAWSPKRITVSTIGHLPGLEHFLEKSDCHLAVSLHSPYSKERLSLMPIEKAYSIGGVIKLIRQYDFSHQRRLSFEYIMFRGLNDDLKHAKELVALLKDIPCRVNLIRYHAIPGIELQSSETNSMIEFRDYLSSKGIICTIRTSRGEDILAACGMLSTNKTESGNSEYVH